MADQTRRKAGGNQPISRHPLFPAIVALWFGALFGLVSAAIKPALIEQAVIATGIDSIIPMAAPPLGTTTRILVALVMTGLGGVIGALVARRIARPQPEMHERRRRAASIVEGNPPVALPVDKADDVVPAPATPNARRKPTRESAILNVAEFDLGGYEDGAKRPVTLREDTLAASFLAPALPDSRGLAAEEPERLDAKPMTPAPEQASDFDPAEGISVEGARAISNPLFESYSRQITAHAMETADESDYGSDEATLPAAARAQAVLDTSDTEIESYPAGQEEGDRGSAAERIATAELDTLSQVELLERLALAMAQRRDEFARAAASGAPETLETAEAAGPEAEPGLAPQFEPPGSEMPRFEAALAAVPTEAAPTEHERETEIDGTEASRDLPQVPAALRPVGYHALDEDDVLPGYIPPRHIGIAPEAKDAGFGRATPVLFDEEALEDEEEEDEDSDVLNEGYSSLLDLSRSSAASQQFARIEEPEADGEIQPLVILPGENARDSGSSNDPGSLAAGVQPASSEGSRPFDAPGRPRPEETERALRAALATLQRMSGAA